MSFLEILNTFSTTRRRPSFEETSPKGAAVTRVPISRRLALLLQTNMAVLTALGTYLLGMGQHSTRLIGLALVCSFTSLLLVDTGRIFALPTWLTNVLLVLALLVTAFDVFRYSGPLHVLVVANLLVYIQCVLQFQRKDVRTYRYLLMLSIFQVVSACAFFHGVIFGLLLVLYLVLAISALLLVAYYGEWVAPQRPKGAIGGTGPSGFPPCAIDLVGDHPDTQSPLGINLSLLGKLVRLAIISAVFSGAVFLIVPRLSTRPWPGVSSSALRTVGFDRAVTLGEMGELFEDPRPVMRVELATLDGKPLGYVGPLYLRGGSLHAYYEKHWSMNPYFMRNEIEPLSALFRGPGQSLVLQRIVLEWTDGPEVFAIWPVGKWDESILLYDPDRTRVLRVSGGNQRATFELTTSAVEFGRLSDLVPASEPVFVRPYLQLPWMIFQPDWWGGRFIEHRELYQARGWQRLQRLAREWATEAPWPVEDHFHMAKHFEQILAFSGRFEYSFEWAPHDPRLDPIIDFLTESRKGHCEYFATALALLLRCLGIPTRIVIGYKTDEFNHLGGFYEVRQRDAHAWVEAYIAPEKLDPELFPGKPTELWKHGAWLRLDPTPPSANRSAAHQSFWQRLWTTYTFLDYIWLKYVMQLDRFTQQTEVYQPVRRQVQQGVEALTHPDLWRNLITGALTEIERFLGRLLNPLSFLLMGLLFSLGWITVTLWKDPVGRIWVLKRLLPSRGRSVLTGHVVHDIYKELERTLEKATSPRVAGETPCAYVERASATLQNKLPNGSDGWKASARRIVEIYYRFRFGGRVPSEDELEEMAAAMKGVRASVSQGQRLRPKKKAS